MSRRHNVFGIVIGLRVGRSGVQIPAGTGEIYPFSETPGISLRRIHPIFQWVPWTVSLDKAVGA